VSTKILHIEKLRALCIALVFLYHLEVPGFHNGFLGVDVFFVISGFLMASLYGDMTSRQQAADYFRRRMARILPAYYAVILITALFSFFLLLPHEIQMVMEQSIWAAFFLPNVGYWLDTSYFDHTNLRPLLNLWSLGIEVQFYLLFPLLLFIERRSRWLLGLLAVGSCLEYAILTRVDPLSAFFLLPGRLWEFLAGLGAARVLARFDLEKLPGVQWLGAISVTALVAIVLIAPSVSRDFTFVTTLAVVLLAASAIVFGFTTGSDSNPLSRSLVSLGQYSYSVYLVHFPIIVFVMYTPFGGTNLSPSSQVATFIAVLLTALVSYLFFNFIERPTRKRLTGWQLGAVGVSFCLLVVIVARPMVSLSQQFVDPKLWNMSNALNDKDLFRCSAATVAELNSENSCLIGALPATVNKRHLLVGDSHADAIKEPLANYLNANNQTLRLMRDNVAVSIDYPVALIMSEALRYDTDVIIAHSIDNGVRPESLAELAIAAAAHDIEVAFIEAVPKFGFNVPARLLADYRRTHEMITHAQRLQEIDVASEIAALEARYRNFHRFPTVQYFCDQQCLISNEAGNPYYYDSNHLTHTGAALLTPVFDQISKL
jgi:peptidoglycan/LPS O-acetylase OafA/YrhL